MQADIRSFEKRIYQMFDIYATLLGYTTLVTSIFDIWVLITVSDKSLLV